MLFVKLHTGELERELQQEKVTHIFDDTLDLGFSGFVLVPYEVHFGPSGRLGEPVLEPILTRSRVIEREHQVGAFLTQSVQHEPH